MPVTMDPDASIKAGAAGADSVQPLALAMILPGRQSSRCRGNDGFFYSPECDRASGVSMWGLLLLVALEPPTRRVRRWGGRGRAGRGRGVDGDQPVDDAGALADLPVQLTAARCARR
jgi:hypothetical protein